MLSLDPLIDALNWKARHSEAYKQLAIWGRESVKQGYRPSIALEVELLRHPYFAHELGLSRRIGEPVMIPNALRSQLARLLNRDFNLGFKVHRRTGE